MVTTRTICYSFKFARVSRIVRFGYLPVALACVGTGAMTDWIETVISVNAYLKSLKLLVLMTFDRPTNGKLHFFGCFLVFDLCAYVMGEALVFGDTPKKRKTVLRQQMRNINSKEFGNANSEL